MAANINPDTVATSSTREDSGRGTPKFALAPVRGAELDGFLGGLAKFYLLNVNGTSLLTTRAAMEMKLIAVMLSINLLFDLFVWTSLWNMVFQQGKLTIGFWTIPALLCGILFAAIIFVYERQFMTADTYHRIKKVLLPVVLRLIVIVIAAGVTTQPFEVLAFDGPVNRRIHEESVRVEALGRLRTLEEATLKSQGAVGLSDTIAGKNFKDAKDAVEKAREQTSTFRAQAQTARLDQQRAEAAMRTAAQQSARARTSGQKAAAQRRYAAARDRADQARINAEGFESQAKTSKENEGAREKEVETATEKIGEEEQFAENDVNRLRDWITQIRNAKPGDEVVENRPEEPKWKYQDQDYDFFQRLGVINDLYYGRPARWLGMNPDDRAKLAQAYGLTEADTNDQLNQDRIAADARTFKFSYWAVIGVAAVIPLLLLALKGLFPEDLKQYYSTDAQQLAGNYETLKFYVSPRITARFESNGASNNGHHSRQSREDHLE